MLAIVASCALARAEESLPRGWLHLNGYTQHFAAPDANNQLYGAGVTWFHEKWGRIVQAWEADAFQDSGRKLSAYAGHSWIYREEYWHAGITAALMYHRNFAAQNRWRVLPVALPFVELPLRRISLRAYYIPPVRSASDQQIAVQILLPFAD
jgi:hypothetical protein